MNLDGFHRKIGDELMTSISEPSERASGKFVDKSTFTVLLLELAGQNLGDVHGITNRGLVEFQVIPLFTTECESKAVFIGGEQMNAGGAGVHWD